MAFNIAELLFDEEFFATLPMTDSSLVKINEDPPWQTSSQSSRWFAAAKHRSPGLGTLSYLPLEIRCLIYREITRTYRDSWSAEYICGFLFLGLFDAFEVWGVGEVTWRGAASQVVSAIRASSKTIQCEFDELILSTTIVSWYQSCYSISTFADKRLSPLRASWIRRVSINIEADHRVKQLPRLLREYIPPNIRVVVIDFDHDHGQYNYRVQLGKLPRICAGLSCTSGLHPLKRYDRSKVRSCKHLHKLFALGQTIRNQLHVFESVVKIMKASRPEAEIQLAPTGCLRCPRLCAAILNNIQTDELPRFIQSLSLSLDTPAPDI